jgi:ubiquinone/menaquinone biosynthesis C-methylase UbiE
MSANPILEKVDMYNTSYSHLEHPAYREIRLETYGADFGQTSWASPEEFTEIAGLLELTKNSFALEVGCGSGGCALHFAESTGCHVTALDVNPEGIKSATALAHSKSLQSRVTFLLHNAATHLPFADATFDAVYSNDAMCHIPDRLAVLREFFRILKPGGRFLFTDALVITGVISDEELAVRSSIGHYLFVPRGENERFLEQSGFHLLRVADTTPNAATIAKRRHDGRARRQSTLLPIEGQLNFDGLQRFLACVHTLSHEQRLSRFLYLASK